MPDSSVAVDLELSVVPSPDDPSELQMHGVGTGGGHVMGLANLDGGVNRVEPFVIDQKEVSHV